MNGQQAFEAMNLIDDHFLDEALKPRRRHARLGARIAAGIAAAFLLFCTAVNLFPRAALAMSEIPVLGEIAKAVTLDPSMRACLANDYAQYVGMGDAADPYHSQVYYMVVDASRVSVFFRTDARSLLDDGEDVYFDIDNVTYESGAAVSCSGGIYPTNVKGLYEYRMDLGDGIPVPTAIRFTIRYLRGDGEIGIDTEDVARAEYTLYPDTTYARIVKTHAIGIRIDIDGQTITIDRIDIYPTQAKLYFTPAATNDKLLKEIQIMLKDQQGQTYPPRAQGVTGTIANGEVLSLWYESPYFSNAESLAAVMTAATFFDKSARYGSIDVATNTIGNLPEGVTVASMILNERGALEIALKVQTNEDGIGRTAVGGYVGPKGSGWFDESGYSIWTNHWSDALNGFVGEEADGYLYHVFTIPNYQDGAYSLEWELGSRVPLPEPLIIPLFDRTD